MDTKAFFREVVNQCMNIENTAFEITDDNLHIHIGEENGFYIRPSGGISCYPGTVYDDSFHTIQDRVKAAADTVKEYMTAMDKAPELKANDFNMPYKKLAEFNEVVFAGVQLKTGEYNFTTWCYSNNSLYHGHYYGVNYQAAKEDFATRSGMVNENKIFSHKELTEMYRCVADTLDGEYELTDEQTTMLEGMQEKIKKAVPDFDNAIRQSNDQEYEQTL